MPKQFCGLGPPGTYSNRFNAHRTGRINLSNLKGSDPQNCAASNPYLPASISPADRAALECVGNSYTLGNTDGWLQYVWETSGSCTGLGVGQYFSLMVSIFRQFDVDGALAAAGIRAGSTFDPAMAVKALMKAFGKKGFYTCDKGTKKGWNTYSICLSSTPPYAITACPAKYLAAPKGCAKKLQLFVGNNSTPVSSLSL